MLAAFITKSRAARSPGGFLLVFPAIEDHAQLIEIVFPLLDGLHRLTFGDQGIGEGVDFAVAEILVQVQDSLVQGFAGAAGEWATHQQQCLMLGHGADGRCGEYRSTFAERLDLDHGPLPEAFGVPRLEAQRVLPIVLGRLQQGFEKALRCMDWLIRPVTHLIFSRVIMNQYPDPCCALGPGVAAQFTVECAFPDLDAQLTEGVAVDAQGAQHQAFRVDVDQCVIEQTVGGAY
ncbi:hypothetical protein D3C86_892190 [compost metagenome]